MASPAESYDVHLGMIRCFRNRLKKKIAVAPLLDYLTFVDEEAKASIRARLQTNGPIQAADLLLKTIEEGSRPLGWYQEFVTGLINTKCTEALQYVDPNGLPSPSMEAQNDDFGQLLTILIPTIIDKLTMEQVTRCLQVGLCSQDDYEQINARMEQRGLKEASRELLNTILQKRGWFSQFVVVLRDTGLNELADELADNVAENLNEAEDLNIDKARAELSETDDSLSEEVLTLPGSDRSSANMSGNAVNGSVEHDEDSDGNSDSDDGEEKERKSLSEPTITLRNYQMEVAQPALQGENIIICLPTGSGKTRVAVYITKKHLDARRKNQPPGKVIVLVNTVSLVEQHYKNEFQPYLKSWYAITRLSGKLKLKIPFPYVVRNNDIIICTAQILETSLNQTSADEDCVHLSDFSLVIIDECHHTQKEDVYNKIMTNYLRLKIRNEKLKKEKQQTVALPQILGLTASPGVGGASSLPQAEAHILQICANLDARIEIVKEHLSELNTRVKEPYKKVDITEETGDNPFSIKIKEIMTEIQQHSGLATMTNFGTQSYEQWLVQKEKTAASKGNRVERVCAEHLKKYNDALFLINTIRLIDAYRHLRNFYNDRKRRREEIEAMSGSNLETLDETDTFLSGLFADNKKELRTLAGNPEYENKKLAMLRRNILEEFTKTEEARGIIFTKTRQFAAALFEWIRENKKFEEMGVKAHYLVGAGNNSEFTPMTQNEQNEIINKFRDGTVNLLVATNVAGEGLDIKECNFTIRYETLTNEIGSMQTRGRARADNSTSIVLGSSDSGVEQNNVVNECREKIMYEAIERVRKMTPDEYRCKIQKLQKESLGQKQVKAKKKNEKKIQNDPSMVSFLCRNCPVLLCTGEEIQVINEMLHVIVSAEFAERSVKSELAANQGNGKIFCGKCLKEWGPMIMYRGLELPCLNIENSLVKYKNDDSAAKPVDKWSDLPIKFPPYEIDYVDDDD